MRPFPARMFPAACVYIPEAIANGVRAGDNASYPGGVTLPCFFEPQASDRRGDDGAIANETVYWIFFPSDPGPNSQAGVVSTDDQFIVNGIKFNATGPAKDVSGSGVLYRVVGLGVV